MSKSQVTTDHNKIKSWVNERNGKPAAVKTSKTGNEGGILRIDFPGFAESENLQEISWNEFFETFENENLAFLYQEEVKDGKQSRFFKFINREENKN